MEKSERIYIAPKRGRLPRRYEVIDERTPAQRWRVVCYACLVCAALTGAIYLVIK
ncbi:MAG TPA: hypothetical protein VNH83_17475 [Bryobacteraceae bacterium]|nr:hypothetical protein [Bryobacteraceae bacterium]